MEPLGAVSSVFAVVSLALQLSSNIQKLIEFWDSVKEAPDEIGQIKSQLRILGELLRRIEVDTQGATQDGTGNMGIQCLQVCNASMLRLKRVSWELNKGLNGNGVRRRWTCLRKAMRERELAFHWTEIERAKSMLTIYQGWKNGQRHDSLLAMISKLAPSLTEKRVLQNAEIMLPSHETQTLSTNDYGFTKFSTGSAVYEIDLSFGAIRIRVASHTFRPKKSSHLFHGRRSTRRQHRQIIASFVPRYLLSSILQWTFSLSFSRKITFATFNLRPDWSPIFEYSITGDIIGVQKLIEDGLASPNDVDSEGLTPLHYAAAMHNATLCRLLIDSGAIPNPVTGRLETPLLLALDSKFPPLISRGDPQSDLKGAYSQVDTVRILVELGDNDPMDIDDIGYSPLLHAAGNSADKSLGWLLSQNTFDLDLRYKTPTGHTAAAYISLRDNLTPKLIAPFLQSGIDLNSPCADFWYTRYRYKLMGPSMLQYATWTWYDRLLSAKTLEQVPASPRATMQTLLAHGADIHGQSSSGYTILDGLALNMTKFDGYNRPHPLLASCMRTWIHLVYDLGFNIEEYINCERELHRGVSHNLGLGLAMELRFDSQAAPWVWAVFQGPDERERGEFVDDVTKCSIWKKWQLAYAIPRLPHPRRSAGQYPGTTEVFVLKGAIAPSLDLLEMKSPDFALIAINQHVSRSSEWPTAYASRIFWTARNWAAFGARYRFEFSFYFAAVISLLGFGYFARVLITGTFYISLEILRRVISF